jgi:hypothetical protein
MNDDAPSLTPPRRTWRAPGDQGPHRRRGHRGLAAAVVLGCVGVEPEVFERAPKLQDVGRSRLVGRVTQQENLFLCRLCDALAKRTSTHAQLRQYEKIARYEL